MPEKRRPRDSNELAYQIMLESTEQAPKYVPTEKPKLAAAVELGRLGGLKGGAARAAALTPKKRSQIAAKAAKARWTEAKTNPTKTPAKPPQPPTRPQPPTPPGPPPTRGDPPKGDPPPRSRPDPLHKWEKR